MRLLLDTHVLLWWHHEPSRLSETAHDAISDLDNEVFLSVINGWEVQIKAQLGKLILSKPLNIILEQEQSTNDFRLLPITMDQAMAAGLTDMCGRCEKSCCIGCRRGPRRRWSKTWHRLLT